MGSSRLLLSALCWGVAAVPLGARRPLPERGRGEDRRGEEKRRAAGSSSSRSISCWFISTGIFSGLFIPTCLYSGAVRDYQFNRVKSSGNFFSD
jgi:hypothetical protein